MYFQIKMSHKIKLDFENTFIKKIPIILSFDETQKKNFISLIELNKSKRTNSEVFLFFLF